LQHAEHLGDGRTGRAALEHAGRGGPQIEDHPAAVGGEVAHEVSPVDPEPLGLPTVWAVRAGLRGEKGLLAEGPEQRPVEAVHGHVPGGVAEHRAPEGVLGERSRAVCGERLDDGRRPGGRWGARRRLGWPGPALPLGDARVHGGGG
ncbi:MAG: hypothetical protein ACK559_14945, partial [bacterium]